jgi:hypothetical protein
MFGSKMHAKSPNGSGSPEKGALGPIKLSLGLANLKVSIFRTEKGR